MFRSSFDKNLENATSHLRLEPDWPSILLICDEINQKDVTPKNAFAAIKKKMNSPNPHTSCYSLLVLESIVKNCGAPVHEEIFTKENCEMLSNFLEQTPHENVRQKMLELVQTWAFAFRSSEKYQAIKDTMTIIKAKGYKFPELQEADAMFTADTAPNWADGKVCHRCRVEFSFTNRKHHCRNCGQVFCGQCTAKQCPLPKYGIEKDVRVCDGCYTTLQRPSSSTSSSKTTTRTTNDSDLPAEYLNSSLSQQVQTPPRKTDQELKEEEELQLALALSQSEAEQKKQKQAKQSASAAAYRLPQRSPSPEAPPPPKDFQTEESNPDLAKYLNRSYWEQRKVSDSPMASPSAPSPMPATPQPQQMLPTQPKPADEVQIDEFAKNMRTQIEIFVNRMKSNSSRGRSIANDSSVQTLFMTLTNLHSQQLTYIKELDDKRMWYEQLQDKIAQIKDSRAALDVLRQEHVEKLRLQAEEQERQRQMQMAQKLDIMRKKKQEYLQYQRQLALQRIQEQEREMQMRQEQQKAQYLMGQGAPFPYLPPGVPGLAQAATGLHGSPSHQMNPVYMQPYAAFQTQPQASGQFQPMVAAPQNAASIPPGMFNPAPGPSPQQQQQQYMQLQQGQIAAEHNMQIPNTQTNIQHPMPGQQQQQQHMIPQLQHQPQATITMQAQQQQPQLQSLPQVQPIPQPGQPLTQQLHPIPHPGQPLPQQVHPIPQSGQPLPQQVHAIPQPGQPLPQQVHPIPQPGQPLPQQTLSLTHSVQPISQLGQTLPHQGQPMSLPMHQVPQLGQGLQPGQPMPQPPPGQPMPQLGQPLPQLPPQQLAHVMLQQQQIQQSHPPFALPPPAAAAIVPPPTASPVVVANTNTISNSQMQAVAAAPAPPQHEPIPAAAAAPAEPVTAELICFD